MAYMYSLLLIYDGGLLYRRHSLNYAFFLKINFCSKMRGAKTCCRELRGAKNNCYDLQLASNMNEIVFEILL